MDYKKIDEKDIEFLYSICGKGRVYTEEQISEYISHDELTV